MSNNHTPTNGVSITPLKSNGIVIGNGHDKPQLHHHPHQKAHTQSPPSSTTLYSVPIDRRSAGYGSWWCKLFFPILFNLGCLGVNSAQFCFLPLLLVPVHGRKWFRAAIDWTKDGFGRLLIVITVLFGPTSLVLTTDVPPELSGLVERNERDEITKINLPDRMVVIANHQTHLDWIYLWILACYCGDAKGVTIMLKASLRKFPIVGWGMRFFRFIFLDRHWATDKAKLTQALRRLAHDANKGTPLWLLIFPEGTITSDEERAKSQRYAAKQGVPDFLATLHPRSTGLLFSLRTLIPSIPDLKLLDITISYPGVPFGKYPQEWYSLPSVFFRGVPPPTVRLHLHLYTNLDSANCEIPSLRVEGGAAGVERGNNVATEAEAHAFELWLREKWAEKDARLERMADEEVDPKRSEVVAIRQQTFEHWIRAFGGGGLGTVLLVWFLCRIWFSGN